MKENLLRIKTNNFHRVTFSCFALLTPPHTPLPPPGSPQKSGGSEGVKPRYHKGCRADKEP